MKTVVLIVNVGSPDEPTEDAVRRYLAEFLMDKYILDLPWLLRAMLVYGIILRTRPKKSAHAYQSIWTADGSPLIGYTRDLVEQTNKSSPYPVTFAMRVGNPSIRTILQGLQLSPTDRLIVIPMYPQYAESTTRSAVEGVLSVYGKKNRPQIWIKKPFFGDDLFLEIWAKNIEKTPGSYTLFSFHGLPLRHLKKADMTRAHCLKDAACCDQPSLVHATCYRHQCYVTAQKLATRLRLEAGTWSVSFQSRLGRDEWISPSTDSELQRVATLGQTSIRVACTSFTTDCLETLEEIEMGGKETFIENGGTQFSLVPCPNSAPAFTDLINKWLANFEHSGEFSQL